MVFTVSLDFKDKINGAVLKEVEKSIDMLSKANVYSGVIGEDERTSRMAHENEFGMPSTFDYGPYKGETVFDPPRPFVDAPERSGLSEIKNFIEFMSFGDKLSIKTIKYMLEGCGEIMSKQQKDMIETWGAIKDNSQRTVETKGDNHPLHDRSGRPFPIKYKVELGGA